jgi:8-oxo-dGTP diphosphatase
MKEVAMIKSPLRELLRYAVSNCTTDSREMKKYVLGFMFNEGEDLVALIRKKKPKWQEGCLNGVGGKIDGAEIPKEAMIREFKEETGFYQNEWRQFAQMVGNDFSVFCFMCKGPVDVLISQEAEQIEIHEVNDLLCGNQQMINNLRWLVPMALDKDKIYSSIQYL